MKVSACLIVRNEEEHLARCLASIKGLVDEIVVVDTGSQDRTREIAREQGARVYLHDWQDDFSLHRNQSISYASGDWLLVIDADEELVLDGSPESLRDWLAQVDGFNAAAVDVIDVRQEVEGCSMNSPRFFRNGRVKYEGIVHNQPVIDGRVAVFCSLARIRHYGYGLSGEKMKAKHERTVGLLKKQIERGGQAGWQAHFYLAQQMGMVEDWETCLFHCRRYLECRERLGERFNPTIFYLAAHAAMYLGRRKETLDWLQQGLADDPEDPDLCMTLADFGVWVKDWDLVAQGSARHLAGLERFKKDPTVIGNRFAFKVRPEMEALSWYRLSMVRLRQGVGAWRALARSLPLAGPGARDEILAEAERNFQEMGIRPPDDQAAPPLSEPISTLA